MHATDLFSQHTHKSLLSHWTPQQTDVGHTRVLIVQRGTQNKYILKVTNKNKFPTLHTRHTPMTDTLFQLCELHHRGHYPVLYSFFSLGQLGTNHRVQSHGPISKLGTSYGVESHGPIPGSFLFKYCCDVQDGKLLHSLLKCGLPPLLCLWVITPPEVADEVDHSGRLAHTCPGMPVRHDCRPSCRHRTQVNLLALVATYNRVSVSLCL